MINSLSFCITCKNRKYQTEHTLRKNLEDNRGIDCKVEFILVDFGSNDGLRPWVEKEFYNDIESEYLKFYYTDELKQWNASIAKNTSHILANNEIVVNLDCDNYTGIKGADFVKNTMNNYGLHNVCLHQFSHKFGDGSYGRIAVSRQNFLNIGGYDESLIIAGYQDTNLIQRLWIGGIDYIQLPNSEYNKAIANTKEECIRNADTKMGWHEINRKNRCISYNNITRGNIVANKNQPHIGVTKNIFRV